VTVQKEYLGWYGKIVEDQMDWTAFDFAFAGFLVGGVGGAYWLATRKSVSTAYRIAVGIALSSAFLLTWVNGAVGIIGSEDNDANMMFIGVLAVGIVGALAARFESRGLARAMIATAMAQVLVAVIALVGDLGSSGPIWPRDIVFLTGFFVTLWLISAQLFRKADSSRRTGFSE
jgi:hypothetical protein